MTFVAAKCPGCGASIQLPDDRKSAACMYCASVVVVEEAVKLAASSGPDASTLIELGETSLAANRQEEAYGYFSRATELDPRNPAAWFGKAKASVGLATLGDMRTEEVTLCCKKFVELSSNDEIAVTSASSVLTNYANMLSRAVDHHFEEYGGTLVGPMGSMVPAPVPEECSNWINRTIQAVNVHSSAIDLAEEHAKNALPEALRGVLQSIAPFIKKAYMARIQCTVHFTDGSSNQNRRDVAVQISDEQRQSLFQVYEMYRNQLLKIDPQSSTEFESIENIFAKQNEALKSSSMCFVATACYGSHDAEPVRVLREFRDTILTSMIAGRAFINVYYKYGPYAAEFISTRRTLRVAVKRILCAPAALIASGILKVAKLRN